MDEISAAGAADKAPLPCSQNRLRRRRYGHAHRAGYHSMTAVPVQASSLTNTSNLVLVLVLDVSLDVVVVADEHMLLDKRPACHYFRLNPRPVAVRP